MTSGVKCLSCNHVASGMCGALSSGLLLSSYLDKCVWVALGPRLSRLLWILGYVTYARAQKTQDSLVAGPYPKVPWSSLL